MAGDCREFSNRGAGLLVVDEVDPTISRGLEALELYQHQQADSWALCQPTP